LKFIGVECSDASGMYRNTMVPRWNMKSAVAGGHDGGPGDIDPHDIRGKLKDEWIRRFEEKPGWFRSVPYFARKRIGEKGKVLRIDALFRIDTEPWGSLRRSNRPEWPGRLKGKQYRQAENLL
jgi:hypothetical protein